MSNVAYQSTGLRVTRNYTASGADISAGDIVIDGLTMCVASVDIADGETGTIEYGEIYDLPKVSAAVIGIGDTVSFDASADAFDDNAASQASGDCTGNCAIAHEAGVDTQTSIQLWLTGLPATVEA